MFAAGALPVTALPVPHAFGQARCTRARAVGSRHASHAASKISSPQLHASRSFRAVAESRRASAAARSVPAVISASASKPLKDAEMKTLTAGIAPLLSSQPGIYAIYDKEGKIQYVGLSRKVSASIALHMQELPELCVSAKILPVQGGGREELQAAWKSWVEEYIEESGVIPPGNSDDKRWTQRKAKPARADIRLTSGKGLADLTVPLATLIDTVVKQNKVVAFIKGGRAAPECGFSQRLVGILTETGADFEVVNVLDSVYNPGVRDAIKEYSQWPTIPQLYVKGEFVGGSDIVADLHEKGELAKMMGLAPKPAQAAGPA